MQLPKGSFRAVMQLLHYANSGDAKLTLGEFLLSLKDQQDT